MLRTLENAKHNLKHTTSQSCVLTLHHLSSVHALLAGMDGEVAMHALALGKRLAALGALELALLRQIERPHVVVVQPELEEVCVGCDGWEVGLINLLFGLGGVCGGKAFAASQGLRRGQKEKSA